MSSIRNNKILIAISAMVCILMTVFNSDALKAAEDGFNLWLTAVMPSLFPFFVCTSLIKKSLTGIPSLPIAYTVSALSGAPLGARMACNYSGDISGLCAVLNITGPSFIIGTLGGKLLPIDYALSIAAGVYIAPIITCILLLRGKKYNSRLNTATPEPINTKGTLETFAESVSEAVESIIRVGGVIIFFSVVICVIDRLGIIDLLISPFKCLGANTKAIKSVIFGMLEMTNGCKMLAETSGISSHLLCGLVAFICSFGGLCIMAQSAVFAKFRIKKYLMFKLIIGVISFLIAFLSSYIFVEDTVYVMNDLTSSLISAKHNAIEACLAAVSSLIAGCVVYLYCTLIKRRSD